MAHHSYEEAKKAVFKGLGLLAVVTLLEVGISLTAKGYLIPGLEKYAVALYIGGLFMIGLSLYKAYFIMYEFMHLRYEVSGLGRSVLLPTLLLIWALIAFFQEGDAWGKRRSQIQEFNNEITDKSVKPQQQSDVIDVRDLND